MSPVSSDKAGKYTIQINLTDSMGAEKSHTFDVKVTDTSDVPKLKEINANIFIKSVSR
jgi:hypothetical protein